MIFQNKVLFNIMNSKSTRLKLKSLILLRAAPKIHIQYDLCLHFAKEMAGLAWNFIIFFLQDGYIITLKNSFNNEKNTLKNL